jgi:hypothetical protein
MMKFIKFFLFIPLVAYISLAVFWYNSYRYIITGDQPIYLMISESIVRDGDVYMVGDYDVLDTPILREYPPGARLHNAHDVNGYSIHNIGLPLLLTPAYYLGGVLGAKLMVALLVGMLPFFFYQWASVVLQDERWAVFTAVSLSLGLPFLTSSNQIYPDMIAGVWLFFLLTHWFLLWHAQTIRPTLLQACLVGWCIGFLPWLHLKMLLPAFIVACFYWGQFVWAARPDGRFNPHTLYSSANPARNFMGVMSVLALGLVFGLAAYNQQAFHSVFGPYVPEAVITQPLEILMVVLGLHVDRMQGMFVQAPHLLLGVLGLWGFASKQKPLFMLTSLVYLSLLLLNGSHVNLYGGMSFVGRFHWSISLLWVLPLVWLVQELRQKWPSGVVLALFAAALLPQGLFILYGVFNDLYLYNMPIEVYYGFSHQLHSWFQPNPYGDFLWLTAGQRAVWLPSFGDWHNFHRLPINWVVAAGLGLVGAGGYAFYRQSYRWYGVLVGLFVLTSAGVLFTTVPTLEPISYTANQWPGSVGQVEGTAKRLQSEEVGYILDGPYIWLPAGEYEVTVYYSQLQAPPDSLVATCAALRLQNISAFKEEVVVIDQAPAGSFTIRCPVPLGYFTGSFMFRLYSQGGVELVVERMTITPR